MSNPSLQLLISWGQNETSIDEIIVALASCGYSLIGPYYDRVCLANDDETRGLIGDLVLISEKEFLVQYHQKRNITFQWWKADGVDLPCSIRWSGNCAHLSFQCAHLSFQTDGLRSHEVDKLLEVMFEYARKKLMQNRLALVNYSINDEYDTLELLKDFGL